MANRVVIDDGWEAAVLAATDAFFLDRLGPDIVTDARRYCPRSGRTQAREAAGQLRYHDTYRREEDDSPGSLAESIRDYLEEHNLIVEATGNDERDYAAYVELGHRVFHPSTHITGPEVVAPESFLRPALYQQRGQ